MRTTNFVWIILLMYGSLLAQEKQLQKSLKTISSDETYTVHFKKGGEISKVNKWLNDNGYEITNSSKDYFVKFGDSQEYYKSITFVSKNVLKKREEEKRRTEKLQRKKALKLQIRIASLESSDRLIDNFKATLLKKSDFVKLKEPLPIEYINEFLSVNGFVLIKEFEDNIEIDGYEFRGIGKFKFNKSPNARELEDLQSVSLSDYITDESIYEGETINNVPNGKGTMKYKSGAVYSGSFKDGKRSGYGVMKYSNKIGGQGLPVQRPAGPSYGDAIVEYHGEWKNDKREGKGIAYFMKYTEGDSIDRYEGDWVNDKYHGNGQLVYYRYYASTPLGTKDIDPPETKWHYKGEFRNGVPHGKGEVYFTERGFMGGLAKRRKLGVEYVNGTRINANVKHDSKYSIEIINEFYTENSTLVKYVIQACTINSWVCPCNSFIIGIRLHKNSDILESYLVLKPRSEDDIDESGSPDNKIMVLFDVVDDENIAAIFYESFTKDTYHSPGIWGNNGNRYVKIPKDGVSSGYCLKENFSKDLCSRIEIAIKNAFYQKY